MPFIAVADDYGDIVHGALLAPEKWNGKLIQGVSDIKSFDELTQSFERGMFTSLLVQAENYLTHTTVTGKKARFEEIPRWQDFNVYGIHALEAVKLMFGFCQESGGRYYGDETEINTATDLKKVAAEATGRDGDETKLLSLEEFFQREFAEKLETQ